MQNQSMYCDKEEYAISTFLFENWDLETALMSISENGFHSVELWADKLAHVDPRIIPDEKKVQSLLKQYKMHVHAVHTPFRNFRPYVDKQEGRDYRLRVWKETIDFCQRFEIPIAVIHACNRNDYNMTDADVPYLHDMLSDLSSYSKREGVKLALENIPSGKEPKNELLCTLINQHRLFGDIKDLSFCLDIGHVTITSNDMKGEIDAVEPNRLITFHIHNNTGKADDHFLPNNGVIDWPKWHDYIRDRGFKGQFVMEVCGYNDPFSRVDTLSKLFH